MSEVRELRGDIRGWRRGRANRPITEIAGDLYIGFFAAVMLGTMCGNVVINLGRLSDQACTTDACRAGRSYLPWLTVAATMLAILAIARLFGPIQVTPAVGRWLVTSPVDRGSLLRRRLALAVGSGFLAGVATSAVGGVLGGLDVTSILAITLSTALLGGLAVAMASLVQLRSSPAVTWAVACLATACWLALVTIASGQAAILTSSVPMSVATASAVAFLAALTALSIRTRSRLPEFRARQVVPISPLSAGLSGALSGLDFSLAYDVLLAHAWRQRWPGRSRRRGPSGLAAVVYTDVIRVRRRPTSLLVLLAASVIPWAIAATGAGRVTLLVAALVGFVCVLPLLSGLRVLSRTPSLVRSLPLSDVRLRSAAIVVPTVALLCFGFLSGPSAPGELIPQSLALATGALASGVRWMSARPPDYAKPLVSTPAGGVPTNLYGSIFRGFDVLLVATAPLLITDHVGGAWGSVVISLGVLSYLLSRR